MRARSAVRAGHTGTRIAREDAAFSRPTRSRQDRQKDFNEKTCLRCDRGLSLEETARAYVAGHTATPATAVERYWMNPLALLSGAGILCGALWLGGCASMVDSRFEQIIGAELPRVVGPAARYEVNVAGARVNGEIADLKQVRALGERVARERSPVLDRVEVTMADVVVNRAEKRLLSLRAADANVRVLPSDIAAFLDAKPGLDNVTVALQPPYEMTVETQFAVAGFALPRFARSKVRGRLVVSGGTLIMEVADLRIAGYPTGTIPAIVLETLINPIVDLSALPAPSRVTSVQVTPDAVLLTASGTQTSTAFERAR